MGCSDSPFFFSHPVDQALYNFLLFHFSVGSNIYPWEELEVLNLLFNS